MPLVQKRRFVDFYAFAIILNVALITLVHLNCSTGKCERLHYWFNLLFGNDATSSVSQTTAMLVFSMALLHYVRRWYETVFISIFSDGRMNILHYLSGFAFYGSSAFLFTDMLLPKRETLFHHSKTEHSHLLIGFLVYAIGSLIQFVTSVQLSRMRRKVRADGTEEIIMRHTIPTGGLFEYISSPHYLAEMIIYTGLFIGCNLHKSMLPLTMFVVVNQTMAALMCHQWYQRTFGQSYPRERKAIIPFIL
ncbi:Polyprenol reductase [Halotydeus destructor]|nr:Polyprenol reductase [Halotydeus destructor]